MKRPSEAGSAPSSAAPAAIAPGGRVVGPATVPVSSVQFGPAAWRPLPPFVLEDRYRAEVEVGLTSSGALFSGRDLKADRQVTILLFHPAFFGEARRAVQRQRLERALTYEHPSLAPTHMVGEAFGTIYAVTAPIVGLPMTHWRRDAGRVDVGVIYRMVGQLLDAVSVIHGAGGVHGSLSPDTLRVVNERAFITNPWTLEIPADMPPGELPAPRTSWLAPELLYGGAAQGAETDVYGIGLALGYLLACGLTEPGHSLLVQGIDVPPSVDDVYVRATSRHKEARYRDLRELAAALEAAAGYAWREAQRDEAASDGDARGDTPPDGLPLSVVTGVFPAVVPQPGATAAGGPITRPPTTRRPTIVGLPIDGSVRSLGVEVLESRAVESNASAADVLASPVVVATRLDIESTSEDEAIPAFVPTGPAPDAGPDAADAGADGDTIGLQRAGRRRPAKTLVGGSPRTGPHERPLAPVVALDFQAPEARAPEPRPNKPEVLSTARLNPPGSPASPGHRPEFPPGPRARQPGGAPEARGAEFASSLESLDAGSLPSAGGPPPLPPPSREVPRPITTQGPPPPLPPAPSPAPPPPAASLPPSPPVELHEPTIVEPISPAVLELDVFGVAHSGPPTPAVPEDIPLPSLSAPDAPPLPPVPDPFAEPPPPPLDPLSDSLFAPVGGDARPAGDRPPSSMSLSAGALALPSMRPDAPISRMASRVVSRTGVRPMVSAGPYGAVPALRPRRFSWAIALAVLAGVIVAIVLFNVLGSDGPTPEPVSPAGGPTGPSGSGALAATAPPATLGTTPPTTPPTTAPALVPDAASSDAEAPDTQVSEVASDTTIVDTVAPDVVDLEVLMAASPPSEDAVASLPDVEQTPDTAMSEDVAQVEPDVAPSDPSDEPDAGPEPSDAATPSGPDPLTFVPKDPNKLTCPGGMAKLKRKIQVELADGTKAADWEVACIDLFEFPGGGAPPRTNIDIGGARGACATKGKRLCTRSEWRRACGGTYPYGSTYEAGRCATANEDGSPGSTAAAGAKKGCRSPSGAYDMVGNVAEWTSDGAVNGGSAFKNAADGTCNSASRRVGGAAYVGFRCCVDAK